jgi:DNA-binding NarL/FixJ family response regulator
MALSNHGRDATGTGESAADSPESKDSPAEPIRLALLDDHVLFRESLARLLASEPGFELVAESTTPPEALKSLKSSKVDVILVDVGVAQEFMPGVRKARYTGKTLVIAREIDATHSALVLKSGASGIFLDSDSSARLVQAIRLVANGEAWVDQKVVQLLAERYPHYDGRWLGTLTEKEQTVLRGVVDGLSNRRIGVQIGVSESTIKATLQNLFSKAGVRTRSQLVRMALERPALDISKANKANDVQVTRLSAESYG